jgi:phosphoglycolate phosphatase
MTSPANSTDGKFSGVRVLVFDLDGTLIDSKLDLVLSVNATLNHMGRDPIPHEDIGNYVGRGAGVLIHRALGPGATEEDAAKGLEYFLAYYRAHMLDNTVTYPGVREALELLKHNSMAVLTNKPVRFSQAIISGLGLAPYFRYVYGGNSFETKKPDPFGMNKLLRGFGAEPCEAMIVGDSDVDVMTARNSGAWSCGVTYGLGLESLRACSPDLMLDNLVDLAPHLSNGGR